MTKINPNVLCSCRLESQVLKSTKVVSLTLIHCTCQFYSTSQKILWYFLSNQIIQIYTHLIIVLFLYFFFFSFCAYEIQGQIDYKKADKNILDWAKWAYRLGDNCSPLQIQAKCQRKFRQSKKEFGNCKIPRKDLYMFTGAKRMNALFDLEIPC